jgi:hypothetical protein
MHVYPTRAVECAEVISNGKLPAPQNNKILAPPCPHVSGRPLPTQILRDCFINSCPLLCDSYVYILQDQIVNAAQFVLYGKGVG